MVRSPDQIDVYLEIGRKRVFAGALDWPGWSRSGRDESAALQALFEYGPRYARVLQPARIEFHPPVNVSAFSVAERLDGNATTDFGAPDAAPSKDADPVNENELTRLKVILEACWQAFDAAIRSASGKELRKGTRGGGRDLDRIVEHVMGSEAAYLSQLGGKFKPDEKSSPEKELSQLRRVILDTLTSAAYGVLPAIGPRGGKRWTPGYFVRRAAWHVLDHTWEIEDRLL